MKQHTIIGGGGCRLHVIEAGNPQGVPVVFIHGFSQCSLAWGRQLNSDLGRTHRLIAMDIRGHGLSDQPREGYDNSRLWADDLDTVIGELDLDRPILCGWSYGPLVILDYVRHYGEEGIGGVHFVAAVTKLGSEAAVSVLTPEFLALVPGFFSADGAESRRSLAELLRLCFARECSATDLSAMLEYNMAVPPFVRQGLLSRAFDNDDLLPTLGKPVLITHGERDAIVKLEAAQQHHSAIPNADLHIMKDAGHAPFWDDAPEFNRRLAAFCDVVKDVRVARGAQPSDGAVIV